MVRLGHEETQTLINWVRAHPGRTMKELIDAISVLPWPRLPYSVTAPQARVERLRFCKGTRLDSKVPVLNNFQWKLYYLELRGDLICRRKKNREEWFASIECSDSLFVPSASSDTDVLVRALRDLSKKAAAEPVFVQPRDAPEDEHEALVRQKAIVEAVERMQHEPERE